MQITINTSALETSSSFTESHFNAYLKMIAVQFPQHQFNIITAATITASNIRTIPAKSNKGLGGILWLKTGLARLIKELNTDLYIALDAVIPAGLKIPSVLILTDLPYMRDHADKLQKREALYIKNAQKADKIYTLSTTITNRISTWDTEKKINTLLLPIPDGFEPVSWNEQLRLRQTYTGGKTFFVYPGPISEDRNVFHLLKAFSLFKKRQKTDWKLVFTGKKDPHYKWLEENIEQYKYFSDLVFLPETAENDIPGIVGAAYAMVHPSTWEGDAVMATIALQLGVPLIVTPESAWEAVAGEAACYAYPDGYTEIADKMMLLYKDENLRSKLIAKGKEIPTISVNEIIEQL